MVVQCLLHESPRVRHNLGQGLLGLLDTVGLRALLTQPGFVPVDVQQRAADQLAADGIDLTRSTEQQRRPLVLAYVANFSEWTD